MSTGMSNLIASLSYVELWTTQYSQITEFRQGLGLIVQHTTYSSQGPGAKWWKAIGRLSFLCLMSVPPIRIDNLKPSLLSIISILSVFIIDGIAINQ